jgi:hypothetical protein
MNQREKEVISMRQELKRISGEFFGASLRAAEDTANALG